MRHNLICAHRGFSMRSPLEVRWARLASAFDWSWQYEQDRIGGHLVDFTIEGYANPILAEVTAAINFRLAAATKFAQDAMRSPIRGDLLMLSGDIHPRLDAPPGVVGGRLQYPIRIGWLHERHENNPEIWHDAFLCEAEMGRIGLFPANGAQICRITGRHKESLFTAPVVTLDPFQLWDEAANDNLDPTWVKYHRPSLR